MIARLANLSLTFRLGLFFVAIALGLLFGLTPHDSAAVAEVGLVIALLLAAFSGLAKTSSA